MSHRNFRVEIVNIESSLNESTTIHALSEIFSSNSTSSDTKSNTLVLPWYFAIIIPVVILLLLCFAYFCCCVKNKNKRKIRDLINELNLED